MRTVRQVARAAGISVRTLHHYDAIGLLKPGHVGANGYRYYGKEELLRLQQILFYRELGLPLAEIAAVLDDPAFDPLAALRAHRAALEGRICHYRTLLQIGSAPGRERVGQNWSSPVVAGPITK